MRFKLDENLPTELARALALRGHDAVTVCDQRLGGSADPVIAEVVQREERILATLDRDFADIRRYPPAQYSGIMVFRVRRQDPEHLLTLLDQAMATMDSESMKGELWIVEETGVRRRAD